MAMTEAQIAERCGRFTLDLLLASADRAESHSWGTSVLSPSIPLVWDANGLRIADPELDSETIVSLADEIIGGAGMRHRTVDVMDARAARRLAPELERLGWETESALTMALEEEPALTTPAIEVAEEPLAEIEDLRRAITRGEEDVEREAGGGSVAALAEQLLEWDRRLGAAGGDSWFTARGPDGERAASCRLFEHEGAGQVEDVGTLAHARRQGLGRAVTEAAARRSRARGDDLTFILADTDDWPRLLYERIGFRPVGSA